MTLINEDWERESQKEYIYLLEKMMQEEEEYWKYISQKPAKIIVQKQEDHEPKETNQLPF